MRRKSQTIAWIVLILSFLACIGLAVGTPITVRWYINNATRPLVVTLEPRAGIVTLQPKGRGGQQVIADPVSVPTRSDVILSSDDAEALLIFYQPEQRGTPVSTLQIHGQTDLNFLSGRNPRFERSPLPHRISLRVNRSEKVQISVGGNGRSTILEITTPQGNFALEEGSYTVAVDRERTEIIVSNGLARVPDPDGGAIVEMGAGQFTELTSEGRGPVRSSQSRGILRNGDFESPPEPYWEIFTQRKQFNEESDGEVLWVDEERSYLIFEREGVGHIERGVTQEVNRNVQGIKSLRVTGLIRVDDQSLPYCGAAGTECPVMIRFTYLDAQGGLHEWLQGFYTKEGDGYSDVCITCEGGPRHIRVPAGAWYPFDSSDLLPVLLARGAEPTTILKIDVFASGHSFSAAVDEVAVMVEE
ncbi:MAG: hypothetical protein ACP5GX_07865 [Anaerolineae bacterium]